MKDRNNLLDCAGQTLMIFGLMVVFLSVCSYFAGDDGAATSSLFSLGSKGMSMASLAQMLGLSAAVTAIRGVFFSDRLCGRLSAAARTVGMVVSCVAVIAVFVAVFGWFPEGEVLPWLMFALSFGVCFAASLVLSEKRRRREDDALAAALEKLKTDGR